MGRSGNAELASSARMLSIVWGRLVYNLPARGHGLSGTSGWHLLVLHNDPPAKLLGSCGLVDALGLCRCRSAGLLIYTRHVFLGPDRCAETCLVKIRGYISTCGGLVFGVCPRDGRFCTFTPTIVAPNQTSWLQVPSTNGLSGL